MVPVNRFVRAAIALACALTIVTSAHATAQSVTISVNGQPVGFDQPPVERAGRVFVPLRGVFERLGASVVYANGLINAQGNGRSVSLHLGSTQATVDGQPLYMDVAPFLIGARTLVPLRFVAQALGASVNWNASNDTVYIQGSGYTAPAPSAAPQNASFYLNDKRPSTTASTLHPQIRADFSEPVNRDTLRVSVDGQDVTSTVYANASGFTVSPPFALTSGNNTVRVTGTTQAGAQFRSGWSFTAQNGGAANYVRAVNPTPGGRVSGSFTFSGVTRPGASVHIVAQGSASAFGGIFQVDTGTFQTDVSADSSGAFSVPVTVNASSGGHVRVLVTSTTSDGSSVERTYDYTT